MDKIRLGRTVQHFENITKESRLQ